MATNTALPKSHATNAYDLLTEVRQLILAEPKRYDQTQWLERRDDPVITHKTFPRCGTIGCVAGWVVVLKTGATNEAGRPNKIKDTAAQILGLDLLDRYALFDGDKAKGQPQTLGHAKRGAAHIRQFQLEHAAQLKAKRV